MNRSTHTLSLAVFMASFALAYAARVDAREVAQELAQEFGQEVAPASNKPPVQEVNLPALPATPAAIGELLAVIPFEVKEPYEHNMRKDRMMVTRGHVLVLRAEKALLVPRQVAEPVLLVGGQTAERINRGVESGVMVVLVPEWSERGADGVEHAGDPLASRVFFASPQLPERVDAEWIAKETQKAAAAGIVEIPRGANALRLAPLAAFVDRDALGRFVADLVEQHAPSEIEVIESLRAVD